MQPTTCARVEKIVEVGTERDGVSQIMIRSDEFAKQSPLLLTLHRFEHNRFEVADFA